MGDLDDFDRQLLELLQVNSRLTGEQLAQRIGLSPAACLRRVQRLRKIGAIEREVAVVSPNFQEPSVSIVVLLTLARDRPERIDALKKELLSLPQVQELFHVTGEADLVVKVACASMDAYANFTEAHFYAPHIKGFESLVVLRQWNKSGWENSKPPT